MEKNRKKEGVACLLSTLSSAVCCLSCFHCWDRLKRSWIYWIGGAEERIEKGWGILQVRSQTVTRSLELLTGHFQQLLDLFNLNVFSFYSRSGLRSVTALLPLLGVTWLLGFFIEFHTAIAYLFILLNSTQVWWHFHNFLSSLAEAFLSFLAVSSVCQQY